MYILIVTDFLCTTYFLCAVIQTGVEHGFFEPSIQRRKITDKPYP